MRFERVAHGRMNAFIALLLSFCVLVTGMIVRPKTAHAANDVTVKIEMNTSGSYQWAGQTKTFNNTQYKLGIFSNSNYNCQTCYYYETSKTVSVSPHGTLDTRKYAPSATRYSHEWQQYYGVNTATGLQTNVDAWLMKKSGETEWTVIPPTSATIRIDANSGETVELTPLVSFNNGPDENLTVIPVINPLSAITLNSSGGTWKDSTGGTSVRTIGQPVLLSTPTWSGGTSQYYSYKDGRAQYASPHLGLRLTNQPDPSIFMPHGSAAPVFTTSAHQQFPLSGWSLEEKPTTTSHIYLSWNQLQSALETKNKSKAYAFYTYSVSFHTNGGNNDGDATLYPASARTSLGSSACIITNSQLKSLKPTKDHYRFVGWNSKQDGSGTSLNVNNDHHFNQGYEDWYAQWEQVDNKLTFNTNGGHFGTSATDTTSVIWSAPHTYVPSRDLRAVVPVHDAASDGYAMVFNGWNSKADGTGTSLNTSLSHQMNSDETWYA